MKKAINFLSVTLFLLVAWTTTAFAQKNKLEGIWYNEEKTAKVEIYQDASHKFFGKIVWLKDPLENGKPKTDVNNSKASLRSKPLMGLILLNGFTQKDDNTYSGGKIYDPTNGKTYKCTITYKDNNNLDIRGYIGISLIGRTTHWTRTSL